MGHSLSDLPLSPLRSYNSDLCRGCYLHAMGIYNTRDLDVMSDWAESSQDSPIPVCAAARLAARQQHQIDEHVDMALLPIHAVSSGSARGTKKHRLLTFVKYVINTLPSLFHADSRSPTAFSRSCRLVGMPISCPQRAKPHECGADSPAQAGLLLVRLNAELLQRDEVEQSLARPWSSCSLRSLGTAPGLPPCSSNMAERNVL